MAHAHRDSYVIGNGRNQKELEVYLNITANTKSNRLFIVDDNEKIIPKSKISKSTYGYPYINEMVNISDIELILESKKFFQIISTIDLDEEQLDMCNENVYENVYLDLDLDKQEIINSRY